MGRRGGEGAVRGGYDSCPEDSDPGICGQHLFKSLQMCSPTLIRKNRISRKLEISRITEKQKLTKWNLFYLRDCPYVIITEQSVYDRFFDGLFRFMRESYQISPRISLQSVLLVLLCINGMDDLVPIHQD